MFVRLSLIASSLLLAAPAAAASQMTAGAFLNRAAPLMKKSKIALLMSSDARDLMRIVGESAQRSRARMEADRAAGRQPSACLPPKGQAKIEVAELVDHIRALPPAEKARSFDVAFASYVAAKYPC